MVTSPPIFLFYSPPSVPSCSTFQNLKTFHILFNHLPLQPILPFAPFPISHQQTIKIGSCRDLFISCVPFSLLNSSTFRLCVKRKSESRWVGEVGDSRRQTDPQTSSPKVRNTNPHPIANRYAFFFSLQPSIFNHLPNAGTAILAGLCGLARHGDGDARFGFPSPRQTTSMANTQQPRNQLSLSPSTQY